MDERLTGANLKKLVELGSKKASADKKSFETWARGFINECFDRGVDPERALGLCEETGKED